MFSPIMMIVDSSMGKLFWDSGLHSEKQPQRISSILLMRQGGKVWNGDRKVTEISQSLPITLITKRLQKTMCIMASGKMLENCPQNGAAQSGFPNQSLPLAGNVHSWPQKRGPYVRSQPKKALNAQNPFLKVLDPD